MDLRDTDRTQLRLWCHHFQRNRKQGTPGICQPSRRVGWLLEVGRPLCPGRLCPGPPETGPTPRQCSSPLTLLFMNVCVCPMTLAVTVFHPERRLWSTMLREWISKYLSVEEQRLWQEWFSVALSEQLSTAVINGKYQQEPGCGLFNTVENGETSSVLLPASALQHLSLFFLSVFQN